MLLASRPFLPFWEMQIWMATPMIRTVITGPAMAKLIFFRPGFWAEPLKPSSPGNPHFRPQCRAAGTGAGSLPFGINFAGDGVSYFLGKAASSLGPTFSSKNLMSSLSADASLNTGW